MKFYYYLFKTHSACFPSEFFHLAKKIEIVNPAKIRFNLIVFFLLYSILFHHFTIYQFLK